MATQASVIIFVVLFGLASAGKSNKLAKTGECVDNTLYEMFVCKDKSDGVKLLVPGSCSQYYQCLKGQTSKLSCPKFYDSITQSCVTQSECVEIDNTNCVIPLPPPCSGCPTPAPGPCGNWFDPNDLYGSFVCRDKSDGTMLLVPESCTDYYFCIDGHAYRKSCGSTLYFNSLVSACDVPSGDICRSG